MRFSGPKQVILGIERVVSNIDTVVFGGWHTSVDLELNQSDGPRGHKGCHPLTLLGKGDRMIQANGRLAVTAVVPI